MLDFLALCAISGITLLLASCTVAGIATSVVGKVADVALESAGYTKTDGAGLPKPRTVALAIHASNSLNLDAKGRPLSVVTKLYKLKDPTAFLHANYDAFSNASKEKEAFGAEILQSREILLVPGQHYETSEKVAPEAAYVGVVALFRSPARQRWRFVFATQQAAETGLTLGVHACALTVNVGSPYGSSISEPGSVSAASC